MVVLAEKGSDAHGPTLSHLAFKLVNQRTYLVEQVFLALSERVLLVLDVVDLCLILFDKFRVAVCKDGEGTLLLVFSLAVDLRPQEAPFQLLQLSLELVENAFDSLTFLLESCRGGENGEFFLLDLEDELVTD